MQKLSYLILLLFAVFNGFGQSPHGESFKIDCAACHKADSWKLMRADMTFDHNTTRFKLSGQHQSVDCKSCHQTLKFQEAKSECIACHTDMHSNTLGPDCARCHYTKAWIIEDTKTMHQLSRFPLTGNHALADCASCHKSSSNYRFEPLGVECVDCHRQDYLAKTNPNHQALNYPVNCLECHDVRVSAWKTTTFDHSGFPLTNSHNISCNECHSSGNYQKISAECSSCHQVNYSNAQNPSHAKAGISNDCKICHSNTTWQASTFNHNTTGFSLTGAHASVVQCSSCHVGNTTSAKAECNSCHQIKYNEVQEPSHTSAGISTDCKTCHTAVDWKPSTFKHITTGFELTGAHSAIVQCSSCHIGNTTSAKPECITCHQVQYNNAKGHVDSKFPTDCRLCHNNNNWLDAKFDHSQTNFPLTGSHISVDCASCHKSGYIGTPVECNSCHLANYKSAQLPSHTSAGISSDCKSCHTATDWKPSTFKHVTTGFELTGAHSAIVQCSSCHVGNTTSAKPECISCHQAQYNGAEDHVASKYPTDCRLCHNNTEWSRSAFDHSQTNFPLSGSHVSVDCASCHKSGYAGTSTECNSCHISNFNASQVPSHTAAGISQDCKSCHTTTDWKPSSFKHSTTGFDLTGAHSAIVQCSSCHVGNTTSAKPECISCHQAQYNGAKDHVALQFPTDCRQCHNNTSWLGATFDHSKTAFPLTGSHVSVDCASCHKSGYAGTSTECNSCHISNFNSAQVPSHTAAGISTDCKTCHTAVDWKPSSFKHSTTGFDLTGAHSAIVQCSSCHVGNTTSAKPECISCHQAQYNSAPGHVASSFPTDCKLCHSNTSWLGATFDHSKTAFPLTGSHVSVDCASCHKSGYAGTSTECNSCHISNFNAAQVPSHTAAGISTDCKTCHTTTDWKPSSFKHSTTGFDLTGAHSTIVQCSSCHVGNTTSAKPECISCHQAQYNSAPGHVASSFPTDCKLCHSNTSWLGATFDHSKTAFPLTGSHVSVDCASCHKSGYAGTSTECSSCHLSNYNEATNPNHKTLGLATSCATCHTTNPGWQPASFAIHNNYYALTGAHAAIANNCISCHNGNYSTTPNTCYACHATDYKNTTNPAHSAAQFPTDCVTCHTVNAWAPSTFNHDSQYFPIYSGKHRGEWTKCSECHTSATNFAAFSCIICHEHSNKTNVDGHHDGVRNYVYNGTSCYTCHPTGRE